MAPTLSKLAQRDWHHVDKKKKKTAQPFQAQLAMDRNQQEKTRE